MKQKVAKNAPTNSKVIPLQGSPKQKPDDKGKMDQGLADFIKYCLGYIKITRQRSFSIQQKHSQSLAVKYFDLAALLNGEIDGNLSEKIKLDLFYEYDPKNVPPDEKKAYEEQKAIGDKIEEIYNQHRNYHYTKQTFLRFGFFKIEIPLEDDVKEEQDPEEQTETPVKIDNFPLFTLSVQIEKEKGEYSLSAADVEIQVNIGALENVLEEDQYFSLIEEIGGLERDGHLSLPFEKTSIFTEVWQKVKEKLRHTKALYDENSFNLEEMQLTLSPKANYFLAEDLQKLTELSEEDLEGTSLLSWISDSELNVNESAPEEEEIYFPFLYDKYKLSVLSILGNRAAIIQGPPGTGKSETIANLLCHLAAKGKKVLFVSQKAQALKVVKDKLKKLDVKYLYGYIPNPSSQQLTEEDETDSVAVELAELRSHLDKISYGAQDSPPGLDSVVEAKRERKNTFQSVVDAEREVFELAKKLEELKIYDINFEDHESFTKCDMAKWEEIQGKKQHINKIASSIKAYKSNPEQKSMEKLFVDLVFVPGTYSSSLESIRDEVSRSGFDRHSRVLRKVNTAVSNIRLRSVRAVLPREIDDYVKGIRDRNLSRTETAKALEPLLAFTTYKENLNEIEQAKKDLQALITECGLSEKDLKALESIIEKSTKSFNTTKQKVLEARELRSKIELIETEDLNSIGEEINHLEEKRAKVVAGYLRSIINTNLTEQSRAGTSVRRLAAELSRAFKKSRKAFKTFDKLRKESEYFEAVMDLIPVWIMELDDASRIIPLQAGIFDYVILDEASQCNVAYTIPSMYRAERALFVGDSEQMKDTTILFKSNRVFDELARRYGIPDNLQIKATGEVVQSVLDIADRRGLISKQLRYYYRSPRELIEFCNENFYKPKGKELIAFNNNYLTWKDTNRLMLVHEVEQKQEKEIADRANVVEAEAILELFKELRSDDRYKNRSVGILSFFNFQATYIRDLFEKAGYKEEEDNYKVSIIEGIQGDEKDIIIYSFVIRDPDQRRMYQPLTGEGGDIQGGINQGRVNVAFSRARLQVHCFVSMPIEKVPDRIWIKKYLQYVNEHGEVQFYSTELRDFDSYFEEEFYNLAKTKLPDEYIIQNQVESCGFKLDFVITNPANGKRLAVECDGPTHFKDELADFMKDYIESDQERQEVLEAAGWIFYRIRYSEWIDDDFDRNDAFEEVRNWLEDKAQVSDHPTEKYKRLTSTKKKAKPMKITVGKEPEEKEDEPSATGKFDYIDAGICPKSGHALKVKSSRRGLFIGCSAYPECEYTDDLGMAQIEHIFGKDYLVCECGAPMVLRHSRTNNAAFLGCSRFPAHKFTRSLRK